MMNLEVNIAIESCACKATTHGFVTSCQTCGFIICDKGDPSAATNNVECPFCGHVLSPPISAEELIRAGETNSSTLKVILTNG